MFDTSREGARIPTSSRVSSSSKSETGITVCTASPQLPQIGVLKKAGVLLRRSVGFSVSTNFFDSSTARFARDTTSSGVRPVRFFLPDAMSDSDELIGMEETFVQEKFMLEGARAWARKQHSAQPCKL